MSEWVSWAMNNVSPSQLQSAMGWAKQNVDKEQLQAIAAKLASGETSSTTSTTTTPATATSSWSSWLTGSKSTTAPVAGAPAPPGVGVPPAPPVAGTAAGASSWFNSISSRPAAGTQTQQSTKQKYIALAIKNWKYSIPVAFWAFSSLMSMLWWIIPVAIVVAIIKKRNAAP